MSAVTNLTQLIKAVRELSYDRFSVPILGLKATLPTPATYELLTPVANRASVLRLIKGATTNINLAGNITLQTVYDNIVSAGYVACMLPYFMSDEYSNNFYIKSSANIDTDQYLVTASFYSDYSIQQFIISYLNSVLAKSVTDATVAQAILDIVAINTPTVKGDYIINHMTLYCAIGMVRYRRVIEYMTRKFPIIYSDGSGTTLGSDLPFYAFNDSESLMSGDTITANIDNVFSLTDQENNLGTNNESSGNEFVGASGMPGTELFFNDENTFWYRYYCYLRGRIEALYGDYTFREESGIWGGTVLERNLNYRTYFDSYPFTNNTNLRIN